MSKQIIWAWAAFALCVATTTAADLSKIERTLLNEPAYKSKTVGYCLLVFGPEAKTRVWLGHDGNTLYVDRNGNGDLTEPGEKVTAEKNEDAGEGEYSFKAGDIYDGVLTHKGLYLGVAKIDRLADRDEAVKALLSRNPKARGYVLWVDVEMPHRKGTGVGGRVQHFAVVVDASGVLQFAVSPKEAPVIRFGGPWQITLCGGHKLIIGRDTDLVLGVGTPGYGPGTTSFIEYERVIPEKLHPKVEITYPPKRSGGMPVHESVELKERC